MNFSISDKIVCIDDVFPSCDYRVSLFNKLPKQGEIYCVRYIGYTPTKKLPYLCLVGIKALPYQTSAGIFEFGFKPSRFRLIKTKSLTLAKDSIELT